VAGTLYLHSSGTLSIGGIPENDPPQGAINALPLFAGLRVLASDADAWATLLLDCAPAYVLLAVSREAETSEESATCGAFGVVFGVTIQKTLSDFASLDISLRGVASQHFKDRAGAITTGGFIVGLSQAVLVVGLRWGPA
jgi:hypothetical protein